MVCSWTKARHQMTAGNGRMERLCDIKSNVIALLILVFCFAMRSESTNSLTVADSEQSAPQLSNITTTPDPPVNGRDFIFTINGSGFDQQTASVIFTGPGCSSGCPAAIIHARSLTQIRSASRLEAGSYPIT